MSKYDLKALAEGNPCGHCDAGQPIERDRHIWPRGYAFCAKKVKLIEVEDLQVGVGQPVFRTQWRTLMYTVCTKCGKLVDIHNSWIDSDGSQRHRECLVDWKR
jgi:hypothetical protein